MAQNIKKKTSVQQLSILVDCIAENKVLLHGKTKPADANANTIEKLWDDVCDSLNSCGTGPTKTKPQWKKTFIDWKCHTRKKARDFQRMQQATGGGEGDKKGLTPTEEKLMSLLSWITVKGLGDIEELGLEGEPEQIVLSNSPPSPLPTAALSPAVQVLPGTSKRSFLDTDSPVCKRKKLVHQDKPSTLQKAAKAFAEGQKATVEILNKLVDFQPKDTNENKKRELDFKEVELKIRMLEARNKTKELELKEKELQLKERELNILEMQQVVID